MYGDATYLYTSVPERPNRLTSENLNNHRLNPIPDDKRHQNVAGDAHFPESKDAPVKEQNCQFGKREAAVVGMDTPEEILFAKNAVSGRLLNNLGSIRTLKDSSVSSSVTTSTCFPLPY